MLLTKIWITVIFLGIFFSFIHKLQKAFPRMDIFWIYLLPKLTNLKRHIRNELTEKKNQKKKKPNWTLPNATKMKKNHEKMGKKSWKTEKKKS